MGFSRGDDGARGGYIQKDSVMEGDDLNGWADDDECYVG